MHFILCGKMVVDLRKMSPSVLDHSSTLSRQYEEGCSSCSCHQTPGRNNLCQHPQVYVKKHMHMQNQVIQMAYLGWPKFRGASNKAVIGKLNSFLAIIMSRYCTCVQQHVKVVDHCVHVWTVKQAYETKVEHLCKEGTTRTIGTLQTSFPIVFCKSDVLTHIRLLSQFVAAYLIF